MSDLERRIAALERQVAAAAITRWGILVILALQIVVNVCLLAAS